MLKTIRNTLNDLRGRRDPEKSEADEQESTDERDELYSYDGSYESTSVISLEPVTDKMPRQTSQKIKHDSHLADKEVVRKSLESRLAMWNLKTRGQIWRREQYNRAMCFRLEARILLTRVSQVLR